MGQLITAVQAVPGTISITATDVYFDADEDNPLFKQLDPEVGLSFFLFWEFSVKSGIIRHDLKKN